LGTWNTTTSLPATRTEFTQGGAYANGYIYAIGGIVGGSISNSTVYAKVNAYGTLGPWNTGTTLGTGVKNNAVVVTNNYIYSIGGVNSGGTQQSITQYAS